MTTTHCSTSFARHDNVVGYLAGHTHTNRVLRFERTGAVPFVEVACAKDYPGRGPSTGCTRAATRR